MSNKDEKTNSHENICLIAHINESEFEAEVLQSKQPVLVAFWVSWSRPCKKFNPVIQDLARALIRKAKVVKVNADDCLTLSLYYDIQSIPTVICFIDGKPRFRIIGTASKEAILAKFLHASENKSNQV